MADFDRQALEAKNRDCPGGLLGLLIQGELDEGRVKAGRGESVTEMLSRITS